VPEAEFLALKKERPNLKLHYIADRMKPVIQSR